MKYEQRLFLPALPVNKTLKQQVIDAVLKRDLSALMIVLPRCGEKDVNSPIDQKDRRTPIHLACSNGASEVLQLLIWVFFDNFSKNSIFIFPKINIFLRIKNFWKKR